MAAHVIARRGEDLYLLSNGVVVNVEDDVRYPPQKVENVLRRGYWEKPGKGETTETIGRMLMELPEDGQIGLSSDKGFCPTGPGGGVDNTCGGSGGKKKPPKTAEQIKQDEIWSKWEPKGTPQFSKGPKKPYHPKAPPATSTYAKYKRPDGRWDNERFALHNKIMDDILAESGAKPLKKPIGTLMGGGTASGKSTAVGSGAIKVSNNTVVIDSDAIKERLPEYQQMMQAGDKRAAAFVHKESAELAKRVLRKAAEAGYSTMLDGTGNGSYGGLKKKVDYMRRSGAKIQARYVTTDVETAVKRNKARGEETGRMVPEHFVRESHASVSYLVPYAIKKGLFDDFTLHDTTQKEPRLVASAKGTDLTIHEPELWDAFIKKGS